MVKKTVTKKAVKATKSKKNNVKVDLDVKVSKEELAKIKKEIEKFLNKNTVKKEEHEHR